MVHRQHIRGWRFFCPYDCVRAATQLFALGAGHAPPAAVPTTPKLKEPFRGDGDEKLAGDAGMPQYQARIISSINMLLRHGVNSPIAKCKSAKLSFYYRQVLKRCSDKDGKLQDDHNVVTLLSFSF